MALTVQKKCAGTAECDCPKCAGGGPEATHEAAARGMSGMGQQIPFLPEMEEAFGTDLGGVTAHTGPEAQEANQEMGSAGYASDGQVAFDSANPTKEVVAEEVTHVLQQRHGVQLEGGVGKPGDPYEQEAGGVAKRVARGEKVHEIGQKYAGGSASGAVQHSVQHSLYDVATGVFGKGAVDTAVGVYNAVKEWVDLLGPKLELLSKIQDGSWAADAIKDVKRDANPKHKKALDAAVEAVVTGAKAEAEAFASKIAGADDVKAVKKLDKEYEKWRAARGKTLKKSVEDVVDGFKKIEQGWLDSYASHAELKKDPVQMNKGDASQGIAFKPGIPEGTVTVETKVKYVWKQSADAKKEKLTTSAATKKEVQSLWQKQLDRVWSTQKKGVRPFRVTSPKDHLLENEAKKWSTALATMKAKVTPVKSGEHFTINMVQRGASEDHRAFVSGDGKSAEFNLGGTDGSDHLAGYKKDKKTPTGDQFTLAHEWLHMIGLPDEYAENSESQEDDAKAGNILKGNKKLQKIYAGRFTACKAHFEKQKKKWKKEIDDQKKIVDDKSSTKEQKKSAKDKLDKARKEHKKAVDDLDAVGNPYDWDASGSDRKFYRFANRPDVPDDCFAVRGAYDLKKATFLRPGGAAQLGGSHISKNVADEARISDAGNNIHPYHREAILREVRALIKGKFDPEVALEHNFKDMGKKAKAYKEEVDRVRAAWKKISAPMGKTKSPAPGGAEKPGAGGHSHDHDHHGHE